MRGKTRRRQDAEFQRFSMDSEALDRHIGEFREELKLARAKGDVQRELAAASELGSLLTIARREDEAVDLLSASLQRAREGPDRRLVGYLYLHLATAIQYLGRRDEAQRLFDEGLACAGSIHDRELQAFILHHRARCFVEQGDMVRARAAFERGLELRLSISDTRAESSRRALASLDLKD